MEASFICTVEINGFGALFFLVKRTFIPIRPQLNPWQPRRRPPHLLTDGIQRYSWIAFDDQLIVNVPADKAMRQRPHGVGQDIAADSLNDVLNEFRTVGFDPAPFLLGVNAHVRDGLAAKLVLADTGLDVSQASAGRQCDKQHAVADLKMDAADLLWNPHLDGGLNRLVYCPPVRHDVGIGFAPHGDQGLEFVFCQPHILIM